MKFFSRKSPPFQQKIVKLSPSCKIHLLPNNWPDYLRKYSKNSRRRQWHPTPVLLPGKSHGRTGGRWELDMTEQLHFHFSLSCIGEGNGNPLQCSCLENPRDGGAWWAASSGVAQSRTRLKQRSSSSSSSSKNSVWSQTDTLFLEELFLNFRLNF